MLRAFLCIIVWTASASLAADAPSPETLLLGRARHHMSQMLTNLPNYTCLQTIERTQRLAPKKKPSLLDIIRIEVALVDGKELFSWPGTGKFVDTEIGHMVRGGAIGTGSFGLHAKAVFQGKSAAYHYEGEEIRNNRKTYVWTFRVPQVTSGFTLRSGTREAVVGYSGKFWIEAATMDAVRLEVRADDIPAFLRISAASDAVEYQRVRIGPDDYLLPALAELRMADLFGNENLNKTIFSQCRQYSGESRLLIDEPEPVETKAPEPEHVYDAPTGLALDLSLTTDVPLRGAAVGDPVTATLLRQVKLPEGVVVPKGALVHGRLTLIRPSYSLRQPALAIGMIFTEAESPGLRVRLNASLDSIQSPSPEFINRPGASPSARNSRVENETIFGSVFFVRDSTAQLRRGLRMSWRTMPLVTEDEAK